MSICVYSLPPSSFLLLPPPSSSSLSTGGWCRRAYYAATSGMDEEIGKLLQGLKDAGVEGE
jgi:hypothetical protein